VPHQRRRKRKKAVELIVQTFGGIDILINNASAIFLSCSEDLDMKRYDLMQNINTRGKVLFVLF
jgi:citronellol/citronellal dehydrogenase